MEDPGNEAFYFALTNVFVSHQSDNLYLEVNMQTLHGLYVRRSEL